jgi:hypothetical protein
LHLQDPHAGRVRLKQPDWLGSSEGSTKFSGEGRTESDSAANPASGWSPQFPQLRTHCALIPDPGSVARAGMRTRFVKGPGSGVRVGPCVDGLGLARDFFTSAGLGRSSHVFGLLVRFTWPLAIMHSADQVPVKSTHSTMLWPKWVVLIAGSTGSALRAVRPFQPSHHTGCPDAISFTPRVRRVLCSARP